MNSGGYIPEVCGSWAPVAIEPVPGEGRHGWSFGGPLRLLHVFPGTVCDGWRGCAAVFLASPGTGATG